MVAAANPLATDAGFQVLQAGGSALDAAIAVQMVLTLVEPQSSGIGGGAFLLHWDGQAVQAWDGRETAPAAADERLFLQPDGKPLPFMDAVVGGRAVGVPGRRAHARGRAPPAWQAALGDACSQPAIALAEQGFRDQPAAARRGCRATRRCAAIRWLGPTSTLPTASRTRWATCCATRRWPRCCAPSRRAAARRCTAARWLPTSCARVRGHATNPGRLTEADLAGYAPELREPICTDWRVVYRVCGFPPPSSGHLALMQILGMLEQRPPLASPLSRRGAQRRLAARLHRSRAAGLCRPRAVRRRPGLRRGARAAAGPACSMAPI